MLTDRAKKKLKEKIGAKRAKNEVTIYPTLNL